MKRIIIIAALAATTVMSYAQTFFEVAFTDPDTKERYIGLFIYNDDNDCKVRFVNDEMLNNDQVAECTYSNETVEKQSRDDTGVMVFVPHKENFPIFVWTWNRSDGSDISDKPFVTYDADDLNAYFESESFQEVTLNDMSEDYVAQFYTQSEPEYNMLLGGIEVMHHNNQFTIYGGDDEEDDVVENDVIEQQPELSIPDPEPEPTTPSAPSSSDVTFHLIAVANTEVSDIGQNCARDLANVRSEFKAISKHIGIQYKEYLVKGDNYSRSSVQRIINNFHPGSNDIVMFFYSGHGFRFDDQKEYYPNMDLSESSYDDARKSYISMTDVYKTITSKGARLNIVLSDCCNSKYGTDAPVSYGNSLFSRSNHNYDVNKMRTLFLGTSGNIWGTASSPGEVSWCDARGGYFILSFLENLRKQTSALQKGEPSWEALMTNAIASAKKKSTSSSSTKAQNGMQQVRTKAVKF